MVGWGVCGGASQGAQGQGKLQGGGGAELSPLKGAAKTVATPTAAAAASISISLALFWGKQNSGFRTSSCSLLVSMGSFLYPSPQIPQWSWFVCGPGK